MVSRRGVLIGMVFGAFGVSAAVATGVNTDSGGRLLAGYDPVSYFDGKPPTPGRAEFALMREGYEILFASAENKARFEAEPQRFMPAYGGYCSYGVRMGQKLGIDPLAYRMVDDRLFLQHDLGTQLVWRMDERENIRIADRIWPQINGKAVGLK
ncbi:MAG: YHS domain-containing (seleno)protein [Pseudomonadota bacterium]